MARISGVLCQVITGNVAGAGTDGRVYLGLGGREFRLDSSADDFEKHSWREYVLGAAPDERELRPPRIGIRNPERNDPRQGLPLDSDNLNRAPVYLRFEPLGAADDWDLAFAAALVYAEQFITAYTLPADFHNLWLGHAAGKIVYLTTEWRLGERALLDAARQLARKLSAVPPRA
jgi:hypothetical protein